MGSIIGQAMQGAGPTLGALGSSIWNAIPSFPTSTPPGQDAQAAASTYQIPPEAYSGGGVDSSAPPPTPPPAAPLPADSSGAFTPASYETPENVLAPPIDGTTGGMMAPPTSTLTPSATGTLTPVSAAGAGGIDPATAQAMAYMGIPTNSGGAGAPGGFWNWLRGDIGAKGALGTPLTALGTLGSTLEAVNRWKLQSLLQDPAALAAGAAKMYRPMSAALKRQVLGPVRAEAQETGQINAPGLYAQSVATALGPYQYQLQMQALADYINALKASQGAYPEGGLGGWGSIVPQPTQGGSSSP